MFCKFAGSLSLDIKILKSNVYKIWEATIYQTDKPNEIKLKLIKPEIRIWKNEVKRGWVDYKRQLINANRLRE